MLIENIQKKKKYYHSVQLKRPGSCQNTNINTSMMIPLTYHQTMSHLDSPKHQKNSQRATQRKMKTHIIRINKDFINSCENSKMLDLVTMKLKKHLQRSSLKVQQRQLNCFRMEGETFSKNRINQARKNMYQNTARNKKNETSKLQKGNLECHLKILRWRFHKKSQRNPMLLINSLINYLTKESEETLHKDIKELNGIVFQLEQALTKKKFINADLIKDCTGDISKIVFYICWEICKQKYQKINKEIEYYSRKASLLSLTLGSCFRMGELYCETIDFMQAKNYYMKAAQLSIYMGDTYHQELAVDKMGMCNYYNGDISTAAHLHNSISEIQPYDILKIKQHYNNQLQIDALFSQKHQFNNSYSNDYKNTIDFTFNQQDNKNINYAVLNQGIFRKNLNQVIKIPDLRSKAPKMKKALIKMGTIGNKKYCGEVFYIPKMSKIINKQNMDSNEVMLSHLSHNRLNINLQSGKVDIDSKIMLQFLNYFQNKKQFLKGFI